MRHLILASALLALGLAACNDDTLSPISTEVETLDLSRYTGSENGKTGKTPGILGFASYEGHLFVPLQRLDSDWKPLDTSLVLEIDPATRQVVREIRLPLANPYTMKLSGSKLLLSCPGAWYDASYNNILDGGVVSVDLATGKTEILARESDLGGNVADVQEVGGKLYVAVATSWPNTHVAVVEGGSIVDSLPGVTLAGGLQTSGSNLLVAMRESSPYVGIFNPANDSLVGKIATGIEPTSMEVFDGGRLAVLGTNYTVKLGALMVADSVKKGAKASTRKGFETSNIGMSISDDVVYVLNRDLGTITGFRHGDREQVVLDWNAGSQSNPYDVTVVGSELWAACYNLSALQIRKP